MLTPEQAREQLEAQRDLKLLEARQRRVAKLPSWQRRVGETLLDEDRRHYSPFGVGSANVGSGDLEKLDAATPAARMKLFEALLPNLAPHLERAWQLGKRQPYGTGWSRRAFRAPAVPSLTLENRSLELAGLLFMLRGYEPDAVWVARWCHHFDWFNVSGPLLAAAVDGGREEGDAVFDVLVASANGEDEVGQMGRHVVTALLSADREDGWDFVERLLIAAQRQEGLRQVILETVDLAHPTAFRRMLALIADQGLTRFSSAVRAIDVWFGLNFEAGDTRKLNAILERVRVFLDDEPARTAAIAAGPGEDAYLAMWAVAFENGPSALPIAETLLSDPDAQRRYAAADLLGQLQLSHAHRALISALRDDDPRIVLRALDALAWIADEDAPRLIDELERLLDRLGPKPQVLEPLLWPWSGGTLDAAQVADLLVRHGDAAPLERLARHLPRMGAGTRDTFARRLANEEPRAELRPVVLQLVADPSGSVRGYAIEAAAKVPVTEAEAVELEVLLKRKAADLRRGVVALLLNRADDDVLASAGRLLGGQPQQRLGGLELLRRLIEVGRSPDTARARAEAFAPRGGPSADERLQLDAIVSERADELAVLDARLGLVDEAKLTTPLAPRRLETELMSKAAARLLTELDALIHEHRELPITVRTWQGEQVELLGNVHHFPYAWGRTRRGRTPEDVEHLPVAELWLEWDEKRKARDRDGFELARAMATNVRGMDVRAAKALFAEASEALAGNVEPVRLDYPRLVTAVVDWLLVLRAPPGLFDFLLDAAETLLAAVPVATLEAQRPPNLERWDYWPVWRERGWSTYLYLAQRYAESIPESLTKEQWGRFWGLVLWHRDPFWSERAEDGPEGRTVGGTIGSIDFDVVLRAHEAGVASEDDVLFHLLEPAADDDWRPRNQALRMHSGRRTELPPATAALVERARRRIVEVELQRGEAPTVASTPALSLRWSGGLETLAPVLARLGKEPFIRGWAADSASTRNVFSHLVRASQPGDDDTPERFAEAMRAAAIPEQRLLELAAFAPQWARHVQHTVGWDGVVSAIWWLHAHTKDAGWSVDQEIREAWTAQVSERTPLSASDLIDGAVDVDWFNAVHAELGRKRWAAVNDAAKYCSTGAGHTRAQLYADAMLRRGAEKELLPRIRDKRQQDPVRALGLVPLPDGSKHGAKRDATVLARYRVLQEFLRTSRQFGSQRQQSEKRAVEIGMANLARTAGYRDPLRLSWAMEARGVADLADGPLTETFDGVELTLGIDENGVPELAVSRDGAELKAVPAKLRARKEVKALRSRVTDLRRQGSRVRTSLEDAMIRGDGFRGHELQELSRHVVLYPKLARLVLLGDGIAGYPGEDGRVLRDHGGRTHAVGNDEELRIAHPLDLLTLGSWHEWQRDCLERQVVQPFKQVFRELYVPTPDEKGATTSRRYGGNQVQPRQALALLGSRGWVASPEEGVRKTFHRERLTATLWFLELFFTPADVEGLTLEQIMFFRPESTKPATLDEVPGRLFSEVMRDLDLVVSVAHAGGVDPETSSSTVEMRAALVTETADLLKLENLRVESPWVLIDGKLGDWSVHLGSGNVHRRPGGAVCIIPVHAQHQGRIFLPFADDDPKTAEVVAKTLLLAKDDEIRDPTILEQLRV